MATILITGASGFIGSFLVEEALRRKWTVWAGMRSSSSKRYLHDDRIQFLELNFADQQVLKTQLAAYKLVGQRFDYVVHCAGVTKCKSKSEFERVNYLQTKQFVDVLCELELVPKQFIYISTLSVYGPVRELDYLPISESDTPAPNTAYGHSKLKAERYIQSIPEFPYVIYRPTGVYGPRETDYYLMAKSIQKHLDFSVGFRRQDITFIYVKDMVRAIFLGMEKGIARRSYFLADGGVYQSRSFSELIQKELGKRFVIRIQCPLFTLKVISLLVESVANLFGKSSTLNSDKYQIMKQRNWQCDITPIRDELGFVPTYNLERGVKETIAWYKKEKWL